MNEELARSLMQTMLRIRRFEEAAIKAYNDLLIPGVVHSSIGQEAVAAGVCANLRKTDYIVGNHRSHGHSIAKGMSPGKLMAELFGKSTGCCGGIGGSMHSTDLENGILFSTGIVGGGIPITVGAGLSIKLQRRSDIVACFFGDGASNTGSFHESLNLASLWSLPVVFVCENNQYALSTGFTGSTTVESIAVRGTSYNIPARTVDGNDVFQVYEAMKDAASHARQKGPAFLECKTYRWFGHHMLDSGTEYRSTEEVDQWRNKCPLTRFKSQLLAEGLLTEDDFADMDERVRKEMDSCMQFASESSDPSPDSLLTFVYAAESLDYTEPEEPSRSLTLGEAIREALREEMLRDECVLLLGEDIGRFGGIFKVTKGLVEEFGPERVRDTPISESAILGAALGAAMTGLRPVAEIMYMDFLNLCMDQLVNHIPKVHFMTAGQLKAPVVVRTQSSLGRFMGAQHSQLFASWFLNVPGMKVAVPSTPFDAKGLLKTAIRGENPVLFIEMGNLYAKKGMTPASEYLIPFGKAAVRREGRDVTIVAMLAMVHKAMEAAENLANEGIDVEVLDVRTIVPLDRESLLRSVRKTGRLLIAEESPMTGGVGAEIAALVCREAFDYLDSPIERVAASDAPVPFSPTLLGNYLPSQNDLLKRIRELAR